MTLIYLLNELDWNFLLRIPKDNFKLILAYKVRSKYSIKKKLDAAFRLGNWSPTDPQAQ